MYRAGGSEKVKHMLRYDTRCYFNVRSKANMRQLNLPHGCCVNIWIIWPPGLSLYWKQIRKFVAVKYLCDPIYDVFNKMFAFDDSYIFAKHDDKGGKMMSNL